MNIKIKYHTNFDKPIEKIAKGDWIDLKAAKDYKYHAGEFFLIDLGVSMELPKGYEALLAPRSSTFKKYKVIQTNGVGVVDCMYKGDNDRWKMPVYALGNGEIRKNDRVAQFRIIKNQPVIKFEEVDSLNNKERGGFGSTGR